MSAARWLGMSTRVVMWLAGHQEVRIDVTGAGGHGARLTVSWEVAQLSFTAADQVATMAGALREMGGFTAVLPQAVHPRVVHGRAEQVGPLPVAMVTFAEPHEVRGVPGKMDPEDGDARWVDLETGYLVLRLFDRAALASLVTALNRAEEIARVTLAPTSVGHAAHWVG